jgi:hypothetical protein
MTQSSRCAIGCMALLGAFAGPRVVAAQSACRSADSISVDLLEAVTRYATAISGDDAGVRQAVNLPNVAANQIALVQSDSLCAVASAAYQTGRRGTGQGYSGRVYVVKVGTYYVVLDPAYYLTTPGVYIVDVFSPQWVRVGGF